MIFYLYKITNLVNDKIYVGIHKTKDMNDGYMGSGKIIKRAIEKYGLDNFRKDILEIFEDQESMYAREKEIVNSDFILRDDTYNLMRGGFGGFDYINSNPEKFLTEKRLSALMPIEDTRKLWKEKFNNDSTFKKRVQKNVLNANRISLEKNPNGTFYGKKHTEDYKRKMSHIMKVKAKGEMNSQFGTMWITNGIDNKKIRKDSLIPDDWKKGRIVKK